MYATEIWDVGEQQRATTLYSWAHLNWLEPMSKNLRTYTHKNATLYIILRGLIIMMCPLFLSVSLSIELFTTQKRCRFHRHSSFVTQLILLIPCLHGWRQRFCAKDCDGPVLRRRPFVIHIELPLRHVTNAVK